MFSSSRKLRAALVELVRSLDLLERRAEKMETILMVREPSSVVAAEAYDGLRKQVVNAVSTRQAHLVQLVQLDAALAAGADAGDLRRLVDGWFEQSALVRVTDPDSPHPNVLFDLVADEGGPLEVLEPAYVDTVTGRPIRTGRACRRPPFPAPQPGPAAPPVPAAVSHRYEEEL